jgi:uncharacterized integral membrane protein
MPYLFLVLIVVFLTLIVIFAVQNLQSVTVAYLGLELTAPIAVLVVLTYLLGMATGGSVFTFLRYSIHKATASSAKSARNVTPAPKIIDHSS